ncbi:MAG: hypothetical protein LBJ00_18210 [Planctomycetaceae bacterium]|jgi:hypothetical protein|nr:hypothetical protein [Planctomycetaceae bacterium]
MTQLFVQIKQVGKRKPIIEKQALEIPETINSLRQLITWVIQDRVAVFNQKNEEGNWAKYLTDIDNNKNESQNIDLELVAETGKVTFDAKYNGKIQDPNKAVDNALLAFEDGLFRIFLDDTELESLDSAIIFTNSSTLTFIRLTMFAGRSW